MCVSQYGADGSQKAMKIAGSLGMTTSEYVYLIPWMLQSQQNLDPWVADDVNHTNDEEEFRSVLIVSMKPPPVTWHGMRYIGLGYINYYIPSTV